MDPFGAALGSTHVLRIARAIAGARAGMNLGWAPDGALEVRRRETEAVAKTDTKQPLPPELFRPLRTDDKLVCTLALSFVCGHPLHPKDLDL